jgi:hypothetical protein
MPDFRQDLERKSERFELSPGALDRLFERRRRKQRNQRIGAGAAALIFTAGMGLAILGLRGLETETRPAATPSIGPNRPLYLEIAGTYTVTLSDNDPQVHDNGLAGRYTMRLLPDGVVLLSVPETFGREGPSPSGISFRLSGNQFTTNAFINLTCPGSVGIYRWELIGRRLVFTPLQEDCEIRRLLFSSEPWNVGR